MRNSQTWWDGVKGDPEKLGEWLLKQYRGEVTAARRIREFAARHEIDEGPALRLEAVALQEEGHAELVAGLLRSRGLPLPDLTKAEDRYWKETLPSVEGSFEEGAAIGAHAEAMRLRRIEVIVQDPDSPVDVAGVFAFILPQERWHARVFADLAGQDAMEATAGAHARGEALLGLTA